MKNKKGFQLIISIIIIFIATFIGYTFLYKNKQEKILSSLADTISSINLLNETLEPKVQTLGKYRAVETAIRNFISDYSNLCSEISKFDMQSEIVNLLNTKNNPDNSEKDTVIKYLTNSNTKINDKISQLKEKSSEASIMSYIQNENLSDYYNNLYKKSTLENTSLKSNLDTTNTELFTFLNSLQNVFNYLLENQPKWIIKNQMFYFEDNDSLIEYNKLIAELNSQISNIENLINSSTDNSNSYLNLNNIAQ